MRYDVRAITADEVAAFRTQTAMAFGQDYKPEGDERFRSLMPLERTVAVFDGDELVAALGDFPLQLTVPGGTQLAMAGTTMVAVQATHTRRGILRTMIRRHLDNAVERSEPVAGLWASEPGIYGRFGFGLACESYNVTINARHLTNIDPVADIDVVMVRPDQIPAVIAPYWSTIARRRAGFIDRGEPRWQDIMNDPEAHRGGASKSRHVVARRGSEVVGYMHYRQQSKWNDFTADGSVVISTLVGSDADVTLALWSYALDVDLFPNVEFWNAAIDDPLAYEIPEARAVKRVLSDTLYVRILDVAIALESRSYERDGEVVFSIHDDMGYAAGTYRLAVVDGAGSVEPTDAAALVSMGVRELGAIYLGRACADIYAATGHITGDPNSVREIGQIFRTARAPWCPEMF